jgi:hypothetical protein
MRTGHNVPQAFVDYRGMVGLSIIGYAITEPFRTTVTVSGRAREVVVQAFERRVLTYTADNPEAFRVEMGNIGQHYFRWRYVIAQDTTATATRSVSTASMTPGTPSPVSPTPSAATTSQAPTATSGAPPANTPRPAIAGPKGP